MVKKRFLRALFIGVMAVTMAACTKVPAGNVGIKVNLLGTSKGVEIEELGVGRYWVGINEELYLFPTFTQNHTYEGSKQVSFQTREGLTVRTNMGISYHIPGDRAAQVFQKYRKGVDEITNIFIYNMLRDSLVKNASTLPIDSVYGAGKAQLIASVQEDVATQLASVGIVLEKAYWVGEMTLPETVIDAINRKSQATQMAEQRENEIRQAKAEAEKVKETAQGQAEALLSVARAEAEAITIKGNALRDNPQVIELNKVERWDGVLPAYVGGGSVPMINLK